MIFNQSICSGIFPFKLKCAKIIPIFEDEDDTLPENYRPISLLSIYNRIFVKLMSSSVTKFVKQIRFITTEQDLSLATRFMLSSLEPIKCMPFSRESVPRFVTLFLIRLKYLKRSSFLKKKELLLNFLRSEDDYVEVSRLIKLFNTLG